MIDDIDQVASAMELIEQVRKMMIFVLKMMIVY